jgi:hypothetical protein
MDAGQFDRIVQSLTTATGRRTALRVVAGGVFGGLIARTDAQKVRAKRKRKKHHRRHKTIKHLGDTCNPRRNKCSDGLQCDEPTTRHSCSSTVQGIDKWCCIPPGEVCSTECNCCGDNFCDFDNGSSGHCRTNPEG